MGVRRVTEHTVNDTPASEVGSTPPGFVGQIAMYSDEDILKMTVFYNNQFGITKPDCIVGEDQQIQVFFVGLRRDVTEEDVVIFVLLCPFRLIVSNSIV